MRTHWLTRLFVPVLMLLAAGVARAEMTVEIVGGGTNQHPIALPVFAGENLAPGGLTPIIRNDLARTGVFRFIDPNSVANKPTEPGQIAYPDWKTAGAFSISVGKVQQQGDKLAVSFWLMDVAQKKQLTGGSFSITPRQSRQLAHTIADMIYQAITGERGIFGTQITYVSKSGRDHYELRVADADGANEQTILRSKEPILSPSWSPDGGRIAYVSFETRKAVVYVHNLAAGTRRAVANFKGSNSAPSWAPDGSRLAVALTLPGNTQIYQINADGSGMRRLSQNASIDTEPTYTPDGSRILFTSDRAGGPQIFSMPAGGGTATRLTYEGNYNVSPSVSPDGKSFTFVRREGGRYRVMLQDFGSSQANYVSTTQYDESPSFAPNGKMILYATDQGGRGVLYTVTRDGSTKTRLGATGDVQEPDWGPFPR